jgi:hypothetical protein|tara:strand:+ start:1371 stop:3404 length:2034 start_codon:yes stop_codon:yes gene_type:complete
MAINKTSAIDLNVPAKVISANVTAQSTVALWDHDDGLGDLWWSGGSQPKAYRWELTMTITPVAHGSHLTRTPKVFNGFDVVVGDYIAGATDGRALQITSITSKTATAVVCKVEDRLRYNTFRSSTGGGIFTVPGGAVIFQINENGHPMIDPLPTGIVSSDFYANISSRFQYLNPQMNYMLGKTAHGFEQGDVVAMDANTNVFELADAANIERLVGTVTHAGPGPDKFLLRPANGIVDFVPGLPGNPGDFIYPKTDSSGDLTLTNTGVAIFLKLSNAVTSVSEGSVMDGSSTAADKLEINNIDVLFTTNTGGVVSIANAITDINTLTSSHKVVASSPPAPNTITSDTSTYGSAYGLIGGYVPFSASINGATVNFSTSTAGQAAYGIAVGIAEDMAADINAAGISNITASFPGGLLQITHSQGTAFTIVNGTADQNGNDFAGTGSVASVGTSYSAASGSTLKLSRADGGEIILFDKQGTPTLDFGIMSGHSGSYALGLNVEKGIRVASGITVVANTAGRTALTAGAMAGDQVHVLDTGEGEWALYLYSGSAWTMVANEDSAATDANSLSHTFTTPVGGFGNTSTVTLGRISTNSRILSVLVEVTNVMAGYTGGTPSLQVGTQSSVDRFMGDAENDIESTGSYTTTPDYHYEGASELDIKVQLAHYAATSGDVKITVTYV